MRWQTAVLGAKGALSVEFWPPAPPDQFEAVAIARFTSVDVLRTWRRGDKHRALIDEVAQLAEGGVVMQLVGQAAVDYSVKHGVTMIMVTDIKPGKEAAIAPGPTASRRFQAKFPGYVGTFVQPPQANEIGCTTVLRFNSKANLEGWLKSKERAAMVKESQDLVEGFHTQRVDTSFPGWVPNDPVTGKPPNRWKAAAPSCSRSFRSSCWNSGSSIRTRHRQ